LTVAADVIGVLEAGYDLDGSDEAWLARVTEVLHPILDRGQGTAGFFFAVDDKGVNVGAVHLLGTPGAEILRAMTAKLTPENAVRLYVDPPPCSTAATAMGMSLRRDPIANKFLDVPDVLGLRANSAPRQGVFFTAMQKRVGGPRPREAMMLSRVASHVGAGLRLRRRLAAAGHARLADAEAILTPSGKLEHAAGAAQEKGARAALGAAARAVDRARGRLRRADPDEAVALWRALVAGQWSLVDCFDHDGRRFVIAHRNQMLDGRARLASLSDREWQAATLAALGHGNKLIAYDLGVSVSTVSIYLARAATKLGASSRLSLIQILRSLPSSGAG
jgi:DNA-binding CsgD family transcriptional regulator